MDRFEATHCTANPPAQHAAGAGAAEADGEQERLTIHVQDMRNGEQRLSFRVKPSTQFAKVADAYCARIGTDRDDMRFVFNMYRVGMGHTIEELGIEDGDVVYTMEMQLGD